MKRTVKYIITFAVFALCSAAIYAQGLDLKAIDHNVAPGDDFYQYANGSWLSQTQLGASQSVISNTTEISQKVKESLTAILQEAAVQPKNDEMHLLGAFYRSGMDTDHLNQVGDAPIRKDLARIEKIASVQQLLNEVVYEKVNGIANPLFGFSIGPDRKNATEYVVGITQGGISLPDGNFYIAKQFQPVIHLLQNYIARLFELTGDATEEAKTRSNAVIELETAIAKLMFTKEELRDPYKTYNKFSWDQLGSLTNTIDWQALKKGLMWAKSDSVIISNPALVAAIGKLLQDRSLDQWKAYLQWNVLKNAVNYLGENFEKESLRFTNLLSGQRSSPTRQQRVVAVIEANLGDLLGEQYIKSYFDPSSKKRWRPW